MITHTAASTTPVLARLVVDNAGFVRSMATDSGHYVRHVIKNMHELNSAFHADNIVVMPDHVHFLLHVKERLPKPLGEYMGSLKGQCSRWLWQAYPNHKLPFYEKGWHDRIIMRPGQLETLRAYIADNPRRAWIKSHNPQWFLDHYTVEIDGRLWQAVGNIFLLGDYDIKSAHISSHYTPDELYRYKKDWLRTVENSGVLAGAFISEAEHKVLDYAVANDGRIVHLINHPINNRYKPSGQLFDVCAEGRLLVLAPAESFDRLMSKRDICLYLNRVGDLLAERRFVLK